VTYLRLAATRLTQSPAMTHSGHINVVLISSGPVCDTELRVEPLGAMSQPWWIA